MQLRECKRGSLMIPKLNETNKKKKDIVKNIARKRVCRTAVSDSCMQLNTPLTRIRVVEPSRWEYS